MSAVYDEAKKARRRQASGFATVLEDASAAALLDYSSSSLGQYVGSAFHTGAVVVYALPAKPHETWHGAKILPVRGENLFAVLGDTQTSTMFIGESSITAEPEIYGEVVALRWKRNVIHSGQTNVKTAQLRRRQPRTIIGDIADDGNA